jgi:glycine/D-amino acid oxidase-like deaminating enzyme
MKEEYRLLTQDLGCHHLDGIEWCSKERLRAVDGMSTKFHCGIYFPKDAIVDSSLYCKQLLQYVVDNRTNHRRWQCEFRPNSKVIDIIDSNGNDQRATVRLESGDVLEATHVVVATGGLHRHPPLNGLLRPCYSYLVHVPTTSTGSTTTTPVTVSPNFFTWGYTHDWCYTDGRVRVSGEDHCSAYKPPFVEERCRNLSTWTLQHYDQADTEDNLRRYPQQYGVYSETPDSVPLVGFLKGNIGGSIGGGDNDDDYHNSSRVCYLLGCNAWGQTILSYCSSLVPGLLGYAELTDDQRDVLSLVSIDRFSELP